MVKLCPRPRYSQLTRICSLVCEEFSNHGSVQGTRGVVEDHGLGLLHGQHPEDGVPAGEREERLKLVLNNIFLTWPPSHRSSCPRW